MKILFISRAMGFYFGGTENYELGLAENLMNNGHKVDFLIGSSSFGSKKIPEQLKNFKIFKCKTIFLKDLSQKFFNINEKIATFLFNLDNYIFAKKCFHQFRYLFNKNNYDLIQISGQIDLAYKIKKTTETKVMLFFPGLPNLKKINRIKAVDGIFSDGYAFNLLKEFHPNCEIIYGGVKENFFYSESGRHDLRKKFTPKNERIILMVNRLVFLKNIKLAINIATKLKEVNDSFKIIIAGDGPDRKKIEKDIIKHKMNDHIILAGRIAHEDIADYYSVSDIFLITSNFDNFPNAVKEAMKIGLPVVASNNSGMAMQVKNGINGFLCENSKDFVEKISYLLENKNVRDQMSFTNKKTAKESFNWQNNCNKYISFINSL